jgi:DNA-binding MarR family transcriptional regulator
MISTHTKTGTLLDEREKSIGYLVHEVAKMLKRRFEDEARAHGLTLPQWRAMIEILRNEEITQVALSSCIDTDPMTMSGILDRLEKRGWIERIPDPNDMRAKRARLTKAGHELVETARNIGRGFYERALEGVGETDRDTTVRVLQRIRENLTAMSADQKESV